MVMVSVLSTEAPSGVFIFAFDHHVLRDRLALERLGIERRPVRLRQRRFRDAR